MRLSSEKKTDQANFDMTPMIDIVFQLIIFFVTVSELAKAEKVELELPVADTANPDVNVDASRLVINMTQDGMIHFTGLAPMKASDPKVQELLALEAKRSMNKAAGVASRQVILRGDKGMEFRHVQDLMLECQKAKIWKLELQTDLPDEVRPDM